MLSRNICRSLDTKIVTKDLIGYWHWQVGVENGIWKNQSPNTFGQYDGIIHGCYVQANGMYFDGSTNFYIEIPSLPNLLNNYTVEILLTNLYSGVNTAFFSQYSSPNIYFFHGKGSEYPFWIVSNGGSTGLQPTSIGTLDYNLNPPYKDDCIVYIEKSTTGRSIYLNGIFGKSDGRTDSLPSISKTVIGAVYTSNNTSLVNRFSGWIKAVRIYNRSLTASEISQNYAVKSDIGL